MCDKCAEDETGSVQRMPLREAFAPPRISRLNDFRATPYASPGRETAAVQQDVEEAALQTKSTSGTSGDVPRSVQAEIHALQGGGRALSRAERGFYEPRFGYDFGRVRIHTGGRSAALARAVKARAFTLGRNVVAGEGLTTPEGRKLLAHELTHVVQQGNAVPLAKSVGNPRSAGVLRTDGPASRGAADVIQRAGDPLAIPTGLRCPTDLVPGRPVGTEVPFPTGQSAITAANRPQLSGFLTTWLAAGGTDDILVHGYASETGDQGPNWTLSCDRAEAVQAELVRLGIPAVRIDIVAHGELTDFGPSDAANEHAVISSSAPGIIPLPLVGGLLTPRDNFASRSVTRFGVGEVVDLDFFSIPPRPAVDFGGLEWNLVSGGGALTAVTNVGTATYTAPATVDTVTLELRVAAGATAGSVISSHVITIVIPRAVRMVAVPGTAPSFSFTGPIPAGTWGAGFQANVFVDPKDVSFQGVVFGEGTVASVVTPAGGFQGSFVHPVNTFGPGHAGNATTGTPVSPPVDNIISERKAPTGSLPVLGTPTCGASDFLWAIPWEFSVSGSPRAPFAGGFTANHHVTSSFFCDATIEKGGAGPFCRRIDGTTC